MQFGHTFPCIFQAIWEADPYQGAVIMSDMDVMEDYHQGTLCLNQAGAFALWLPLTTNANCVIICTDMVLHMGWVKSPNLFCVFSETLIDVVNSINNTFIRVPLYGAIAKIPKIGLLLTYSLYLLTHILLYRWHHNGSAKRSQKKVPSQLLNWVLPSLSNEANYSVIVKKLMAGDKYWTCAK